MRNFRYAFRLTLAFLNRFKGLILLGLIIGIILFFALNIIIPLAAKKQERIGLTGRYQTNNLPLEIQRQISRGLTKLNDDNLPSPDLAQSWETPDKGKTWVFHLAEGNYWHDGEKVTASTIHYEFSDVTIEKTDEKTVVFKLKEAFIPFPNIMSKPVFKKGLLGTGAWKVKKISLTGPNISEIYLSDKVGNIKHYKFYPTLERTKLAYKLGEVDEIIDLFDVAPFDDWKGTSIKEFINKNQVVTLFFNTSDESSVFADKETARQGKSLRQALAYAIDKNEWIDKRAFGPISPNSWAYNPQVKQYSFDQERAKELIKDVPKEIKAQFPVKLVTTPILLSVAEKIASDWKAVGVDTIVQVSSIIPSDFQVFLTIFDIPSDPDQYSIWHSTQDTNISKYKSQRIDKLLEDGRIEQNQEERKRIYLDFQRYLLEDLPAVFLYHPAYFSVARR